MRTSFELAPPTLSKNRVGAGSKPMHRTAIMELAHPKTATKHTSAAKHQRSEYARLRVEERVQQAQLKYPLLAANRTLGFGDSLEELVWLLVGLSGLVGLVICLWA